MSCKCCRHCQTLISEPLLRKTTDHETSRAIFRPWLVGLICLILQRVRFNYIVLIIKATASMFRPRFCNQMLCTNISSSTFFSPSLSKPLCNYVLFGMHVVQTIGWILIKHTVSPSHILFDSLFRSFFIICQYVNPILYVQHNSTFWHSM